MKCKLVVVLTAVVMMVTLTACGAGEETTLTGMVVSVNGNVISIMEMDQSMGEMNFDSSRMPNLPEGENTHQMPSGEIPTMPDGETMSQMPNGEMPAMPEGMTVPDGGALPNFSGENSGIKPDFDSMLSDMKTTEINIEDAHISVEIDEGKATGSLEDVIAGCLVTITMNEKGEVTNVLIFSQFSFGQRKAISEG